MTGLEKMKNQILEEAKGIADSKIQKADEKAKEILDAARDEAGKTTDSIARRSQAEVANYQERVVSSIDLQHRTKILGAKQELIAGVLDKAYESLTSMETGEYFAMLLKLLEKHALPEKGELYLSDKDNARKPSSFVADAEKIAESKGGSLTISAEGRSIENGFVLAYGGIEENCTLRAMFDEKKDDLSDIVRELLFA